MYSTHHPTHSTHQSNQHNLQQGVANNDDIRKLYEEQQPRVVQTATQLAQNRALYDIFKAIASDAGTMSQLDPARQRIIQSYVLQAELAGVALQGEAQETFNQLKYKTTLCALPPPRPPLSPLTTWRRLVCLTTRVDLATLSGQFSNNALDASADFALDLSTEEVEGLPATALAQAQDSHAKAHQEGEGWRFTLDLPSYIPFMQHCKHSNLREQMFRYAITQHANSTSHANSRNPPTTTTTAPTSPVPAVASGTTCQPSRTSSASGKPVPPCWASRTTPS